MQSNRLCNSDTHIGYGLELRLELWTPPPALPDFKILARTLDVLWMALELESYKLASRQRAQYVREGQLESDYPVQQQASTSEAGPMPARLEGLQGYARPRRRSADQPTSRGERKSATENTLVCWECNKRGHRRPPCPQLRKRQQIDNAVFPPGNRD